MRSPASRDGTLVIGYGNGMRGDDGAGPAAARLLSRCGFEALAVHQLTPELAERVAAARAVFFLDASADVAPGEISVQPIEAAAAPRTLEHYASPGAILRLAREAYGAAPDAWLIAVGAVGFEFGAGLSPAAEGAVLRAVEQVRSAAPPGRPPTA